MSLSPATVTPENWTVWKNSSQLERTITKAVLNSVCLLVCIFGLAGNGIVVFFLGFRIKKNQFTVYILNLALADFMFLLCASFLMVLVTAFIVQPQTLDHRPDLENVVKVVTYILLACLFGYNTSLYLLTAISVERCLSVLYPIWYQCRRPKHQSAVVCSLLWMLSCLVTSAEFFICDKRKYISEHQGILTKNSERCKVVYISIGFLSFLIFTPLMVLSSLTLLIKVKKDSWKRQPSTLYIIIVATVVLFLIFGMPIRMMLQAEYKLHTLLPMVLVDVSSLLCSINSSVNPFVYWFVGRRDGEKGSIHLILQRIFKEDMKEHKQQHPGETVGMNGTGSAV